MENMQVEDDLVDYEGFEDIDDATWLAVCVLPVWRLGVGFAEHAE